MENFDLNQIPEKLRMLGLSLYWCEGTKNHSKTAGGKKVELVNSDKYLIIAFLKFLRCLNIDENRLRGKVKIHKNQNIVQIEQYWSHISKIPLKQFHKPIIRNYDNNNKNSVGTFTVIYSSTKLWKCIMEGIRIHFKEPRVGIEPTTSALPMQHSTN